MENSGTHQEPTAVGFQIFLLLCIFLKIVFNKKSGNPPRRVQGWFPVCSQILHHWRPTRVIHYTDGRKVEKGILTPNVEKLIYNLRKTWKKTHQK